MAITSPRASSRGFRLAPTYWGEEIRQWIRLVAETINEIMDGKINATGSITLTENQATTTLADRRIGPNSHIKFTPQTANAATEITALYVSSRGKQTATLTHNNAASTDRTFSYAVLG